MKRWIFYIAGLATAAFGVASIITSDLGAGPWDTVFVGLSNTVGLTAGNWMIILGGILMLFNGFLSKSRPDFPGFLTVFIVGMFVDLFLLIYGNFNINSFLEKGVLFVLGFLILATGASMYLQAKFAPNPIDSLMMVVSKRFGLSIAVSRLICEVFALTMGLLLAGPVSYGTVVIALSVGPVIQFTYGKMEKIYNGVSEVSKAV